MPKVQKKNKKNKKGEGGRINHYKDLCGLY